MFDTLAVARTLTAAGMDPKHADALTDAIRQATEHAEYATKGDLAELRAEFRADLAALETRLVRWMVAIGGVIIAAQRFL